MSHSQFHSIDLFILRHAWLNLWDKRMLLAESTRLLSLKKNINNFKNYGAGKKTPKGAHLLSPWNWFYFFSYLASHKHWKWYSEASVRVGVFDFHTSPILFRAEFAFLIPWKNGGVIHARKIGRLFNKKKLHPSSKMTTKRTDHQTTPWAG